MVMAYEMWTEDGDLSGEQKKKLSVTPVGVLYVCSLARNDTSRKRKKNKEEEKSMACVNSIRSLIAPSAALCNHSMAFLTPFFFERQRILVWAFPYANRIVKPLRVPCIHIVAMVNSYFKRKQKKEINGCFYRMQLITSLVGCL